MLEPFVKIQRFFVPHYAVRMLARYYTLNSSNNVRCLKIFAATTF